ncbi:unnamed protein product [Symbiodinium pilosum]|uniref:Uncharacterized protein n=1 Tax=Symbiodinium pilosum TaxID=2952 RepID=A0A812MET7_SYMPI|nr:unnamed protein product [Symbiodinium pilosum]
MPDRRPEGQRRGDETAFGGVRVSLTLRVVATFQLPDGRLYGQGARRKTVEDEAASPADSPEEGRRMAEAFRRENVDPNFDWATYYGQGFDLLAPSYAQPARKVVTAEDLSRTPASAEVSVS